MIKRTLLFAVVTFLFFSCKSDSDNFDSAPIQDANFTINGINSAKTGGGYVNTTDLLSDKESYMFYAVAEEPITLLTDIKPAGSHKVEWRIDGKEWKLNKVKKGDKESYTYSFKMDQADVPLKVEMNVNDDKIIYKHIYVVETAADIPPNAKYKSSGVIAENITTPEEPPADPVEDPGADPGNTNVDNTKEKPADVKVDRKKEEPKKSDPPKTEKKKEEPKKKNTPPPPPPPKKPEIKTITFSFASGKVVEDVVRFEDKSTPAEAVSLRTWDFGDGSSPLTKRGTTANHKYFSAGTFTVKLCLNGSSSQCRTKKVVIKKKPVVAAEKVRKPPPPVKPPVEEKKKPAIASYDFNLVPQAIVGDQVKFEDKSGPKEAISSRKWYINGIEKNTLYASPTHSFDKAGTYQVKLCLNGQTSGCKVKSITIKDRAVVIKTADSPFSGDYTDRTGIRSSQICGDEDIKWHQGKSFVNITPKKKIELESVKIYSDNTGKVDLMLSNGSKTVIENLKGKAVLAGGATTITLSDFGVILEPNVVYTLLVLPAAGNEDFQLKDSRSCNPNPVVDNSHAKLQYNDQMVLYDLVFNYD